MSHNNVYFNLGSISTLKYPMLMCINFPVDDGMDNSYDFFTKEYEEVEQAITSETSGGEGTETEIQETGGWLNI